MIESTNMLHKANPQDLRVRSDCRQRHIYKSKIDLRVCFFFMQTYAKNRKPLDFTVLC
jgi:hypothetical protein